MKKQFDLDKETKAYLKLSGKSMCKCGAFIPKTQDKCKACANLYKLMGF